MAFIALCLVPESPAWLIRRKKIDKAKKALLWLRGGNIEQVKTYKRTIFIQINYKADVIVLQTIKIILICQMLTELELLNTSIRADLARKPVNTSFKERISSALSTIRDPGVLKPLIIINVFNALQLSCGTYIIVFYAVDMVKDIGEKEFQYHYSAKL